MNCTEFRRAFGADPQHAVGELCAHRTQCGACDQYAQEMLRLDGLIKRALEVPVPEARNVSQLKSRPSSQSRWYAMAASIAMAIGIAGAVWFLGFPRSTLAQDVVAHVKEEPEAMQTSEARISAQLIDSALQDKGLRLARPMGEVSFLGNCRIRGHNVPHLVVRTEGGPVTVIVLPEENVKSVQRFDEQQYHGMIVPTPHGSMAVLATDASLVQQVVDKVRASIAWN